MLLLLPLHGKVCFRELELWASLKKMMNAALIEIGSGGLRGTVGAYCTASAWHVLNLHSGGFGLELRIKQIEAALERYTRR